MPSKSKSQFRYFKFLGSHPEKAQEKGLSEPQIQDFTKMSKGRWSKLKEKVRIK